MELAFPWPYSQGEWMAFWAAAATCLAGLVLLLLPRLALALLAPGARRNGDAAAMVRALPGGFMLGQGLACILLAQQMLYLSLAMAWGAAAIGAVLAFFLPGATRLPAILLLLLAAVLAGLSGAHALGYAA
ncbi:MAG: DUF4345 domain-containing protein [Zhengella sp.]|uniref:DUF4345 domain-containing protein n=1 Tax=Zhengella sp. TaxID=2282762 RepID=UPI001D982927|nr:DUF4345 domain-containing protein [Notoacmeibacter sp.]MCC0027812.1 DUF4345 domain-containing protein [Brucellaceae bacterium]